MTKRQFGELEAIILNLFKKDQVLTVRQVHQILGEKNNYNTIMTVMYRLSQKKVLDRRKVGSCYEYWLLPQEEKALSFFQQLKQKFSGFGASQLVSHLIQSNEISDEELKEIEDLILKAKAEKKSKK